MASSSSHPKCEFAHDCDGKVILGRLGQVLDPELDEPILQLGFVRSIHVQGGHAVIALQLPTSWCAVNFAYQMAEDIRVALVAIDGIDSVTVHLGDHCAAEQIEAAVNEGKTFVEAFPGEGSGGAPPGLSAQGLPRSPRTPAARPPRRPICCSGSARTSSALAVTMRSGRPNG
jgi:metal-sulfur cluster biosynthetic enzyme